MSSLLASSRGHLAVARIASGQRQWLKNHTHCPHRKLNKSSSTVEDPAVLKLPLTEPKLKKITLHFPLGLEVTARNLKGVTIKDALDAIHKQFKKRVSILISAVLAAPTALSIPKASR